MLNREQEVLTLELQNPERRRRLHRPRRSAIFSCANKCAPSSANWAKATPSAGEIKSLREKIEQTVLPDEARKAALQELERLQQMPPAAAEYGVARNYLDWILASAVGKIHRGQTGFEGGGKNSERTTFRPATKSRTGCWNFSPSSSAASRSKARFSAWSARPASAKLRSAKAWPTRWAANLRAFRSAACATRRKFAAIAALMSARCPDASSRRLRRVESRNPVILLDEFDKVGADFRGDPGGRAARSARPGAEQHVHRSLSGFAV